MAAASTAVTSTAAAAPLASRTETRSGPRIAAQVDAMASIAYAVTRNRWSATSSADSARAAVGVPGTLAPPANASAAVSQAGPPPATTATSAASDAAHASPAAASTNDGPRRSIHAP